MEGKKSKRAKYRKRANKQNLSERSITTAPSPEGRRAVLLLLFTYTVPREQCHERIIVRSNTERCFSFIPDHSASCFLAYCRIPLSREGLHNLREPYARGAPCRICLCGHSWPRWSVRIWRNAAFLSASAAACVAAAAPAPAFLTRRCVATALLSLRAIYLDSFPPRAVPPAERPVFLLLMLATAEALRDGSLEWSRAVVVARTPFACRLNRCSPLAQLVASSRA